MRILFVDVTRDFGLTTPLHQPLGGLQSAISYLATELNRAGHAITIVNATLEARWEDGVHFIPWNYVPWEGAAEADAIVVVAASSEMLADWHARYGAQPLWLFWAHHDVDQQAVALLHDAATRDLLDGFLFVSEWQAKAYRDSFSIGWDRALVLRNGVSPAFLDLFPPGQPVWPQKSAEPVLFYSSTPYRGLDVLADAIPLIQDQVPDARFKIFSSWKVYGRSDEEDPHRDLYTRLGAMPGVDYIGSVPQAALAQHLKSAWCLAYPTVFKETSCIAVMEALTAGCKVVSTHHGALPETTGGLARLIVNPRDRTDLVTRFATVTAEVLRQMRAAPDLFEAEAQGGLTYARRNFSWRDRAPQLTEWLSGLLLRKGRRSLGARFGGALPPGIKMTQARHGTFVVPDDDSRLSRSLLTYGEWAEPAVALMQSGLTAGDTVLDIGAGIGAEAIALAKAVGPGGTIWAFEPRPAPYRLLETNLALNGMTNVRAARCTVGNVEDGLARVRLDRLYPAPAQCRLIRLEGYGDEIGVLRGGSALIARCRPVIYCTLSDAAGFDAITDFMYAHNYAMHWHGFGLFSTDNHAGAPTDLFNGGGEVRLLCVPRFSGLISAMPPASFFQDVQTLYPGLRPGGTERSRQPALPAPMLPDLLRWRYGTAETRRAGFANINEQISILRAHRDYVHFQGYSGGDAGLHGLWFDMIRHLGAGARLLEIGEGKLQAVTLWGLIGKVLAQAVDAQAMTRLRDPGAAEGGPLSDERQRIDRLVRLLALAPAWPTLFDESIDPIPAPQYQAVYLHTQPDEAMARARLARYAPLVAPGGFLVLGNGIPRQIDPALFGDPIEIGASALYQRR